MTSDPLSESLPENIPADFDYSTVDWDKVIPESEVRTVSLEDEDEDEDE